MPIEEQLTRSRQQALDECIRFPWDLYGEPEASVRFLAARKRWRDTIDAYEAHMRYIPDTPDTY